MSTSAASKPTAEQPIQRNPHPDFKKVEASRAPFDSTRKWSVSQTPQPEWRLGDGANDNGASLAHEHVEIDPYAAGRPAAFNYKLLISAVVPRPIGFLSTRSADGASTNLAPYSFTQLVNYDPPIFTVSFNGPAPGKDSLRNLRDTRECTINIVGEHMLEAANATSVNAPFGVSEWALTGLTPAPSAVVKPSRVKESVFSVEGRLLDTKEFQSRADPSKTAGVLAFIEGVRFWAREDAINEERNLIDIGVLRPVSRLGGITYARVLDGIEIPRPDWDEKVKAGETDGLVEKKLQDQSRGHEGILVGGLNPVESAPGKTFQKPGPKQLMATITMASTSSEPRNSGPRGHRKRPSGAAPPVFSFPATPVASVDGPGHEDELVAPVRVTTPPSTPPLQTSPQLEAPSWEPVVASANQPDFDPDFAPPDVAIISSTPPDNVSQSSPSALPVFSFGAGSELSQDTIPSEQQASRRKHRHKRSTAQSIDVSGLDLRPHTAGAEATTPTSASTEESRTPATTPHKLTFGPSAQMDAHQTPPSSRGSSVRFSDPPPLPTFRRDRLTTPDQDDESALIDLDLAVVDNPPSPRVRNGRRAGSMHSGGNRIVISQPAEGHRRTESAPQLAPAFILDSNYIRRQSMTPSTLFPLGDVFEEDEEQEPRLDTSDMTNSALPSPQTTLATPRLDTANSSALTFASAATTSDGDFAKRPSSRRKRFGRKLMFWKWKNQSDSALSSNMKSN
ncbi:hypothetical protein FH972_025634 [Carpinus fangiana]|uniref:Flavin reductase like domain-containing protein n=1 Tax=Carpinus fangiana TaxID=176857 RepID=A0A5N6L268_9ROSI|nr:hypothetical protein FH972_025634 [Carpinus fangiana]